MKTFLKALFIALFPLILIISINYSREVRKAIDNNYEIPKYNLSIAWNYLIDSWDSDYIKYTENIERDRNIIDNLNWSYSDYVPFNFVSLKDSDEPLKDFFRNFVAFFRMVGNFFANAGMFIGNVANLIGYGLTLFKDLLVLFFDYTYSIIKFAFYFIGFNLFRVG